MKQKALWINQIKGLCICLVVIYHSVITFYPHLSGLQHPLSGLLAKCWVYFNLYLAPFRMPVFFFISGYLIRRYIDEVGWRISLDKRIWSIVWVLALWGVLQWQALSHINAWLAPERELATSSNTKWNAPTSRSPFGRHAGSIAAIRKSSKSSRSRLWKTLPLMAVVSLVGFVAIAGLMGAKPV